MRRVAVALALTLALALAGPAFAGGDVGEVAPAIQLKKLGGGDVSLADHAGKAVVLCFFATWSKASVEQLRELVPLHRQGIAVLGICLDVGGDEAVARTVEREGIPMPIALGGGDADLARAYALEKLPTVVVVSKDGRIAARFDGFKDPAAVKAEIDRLAAPAGR